MITFVVAVSVYSYLLSLLKPGFKKSFAAGVALCFVSSVFYVTHSMHVMGFSSILLGTVIVFAILSGFYLFCEDSRKVVFPALLVSVLFSLGYGTLLTYRIVYPALSYVGYTGFMYTAFGMLGIFLQAFVESALVSFVVSLIF